MKKFILPILAIIFFTLIFNDLYSQGVTIRVLNVGQGDALLLTTKNGHSMMIDVGGQSTSLNKIIIPTLKSLNIQHLDYVVATHYDKDHIIGITGIIKSGIIIDTLFDRGPVLKRPKTSIYQNYAKSVKPFRHSIPFGYTFYLDSGVMIKCVSVNGQYGNNKNETFTTNDENTLSIGLLIQSGNFKMYTAGDVDTPVEDNISGISAVNLIKISHHGSRTATSQVFLDKIAPQVAVISCGSNTTYKHPHQEVVERLGNKSSIKYIYQTQKGSGKYSKKVKILGTVSIEVFNKYFVVNGDTLYIQHIPIK